MGKDFAYYSMKNGDKNGTGKDQGDKVWDWQILWWQNWYGKSCGGEIKGGKKQGWQNEGVKK